MTVAAVPARGAGRSAIPRLAMGACPWAAAVVGWVSVAGQTTPVMRSLPHSGQHLYAVSNVQSENWHV